jgi:hypothetical protein
MYVTIALHPSVARSITVSSVPIDNFASIWKLHVKHYHRLEWIMVCRKLSAYEMRHIRIKFMCAGVHIDE